MDSFEFNKIQKELGNYLYEYEKFIKDGHYLDMKYTNQFYSLLEEQFTINFENILLQQVCSKLIDKQSLDDIDSFIKSNKKEYNQKLVSYRKKNGNSKYVINAFNNDEVTKEFEEIFKAYCIENHPAVKIMITKLERLTFDELRVHYLNNNLSAYTELYELQKGVIRPCMLNDEQYSKAIEYYDKIKNDIANEMEAKLSEYPYNKKEVFENEITIAREKAELVVDINRKKQMNKALHQDIVNLYGEDITIK